MQYSNKGEVAINNVTTQDKQVLPKSKPRKIAAKRAKINHSNDLRKQRTMRRSNNYSKEEEPLQDSNEDSDVEDTEYDQSDSSQESAHDGDSTQ